MAFIDNEIDRDTLQSKIGIKHRTYFRNNYIKPAIEQGYIEFTLPNEKQSKYNSKRICIKRKFGKRLTKNVMNTSKFKCIKTLKAHVENATCLSFSSNGE